MNRIKKVAYSLMIFTISVSLSVMDSRADDTCMFSVTADDVPPNIGLVDVDGDGVLEAGYVAINDTKFVCRDVWTGKIEWTVTLPSPPNATTITADFDGDGRGEFFCGRFCIGTNDQGVGELRWVSPIYFSWPVIADFDWPRPDSRREFLRARLVGGAGDQTVVQIFPNQDSGVLTSTVWADGFVEIAENQTVQAGDTVNYLPFAQFIN